MRWKEKCGMLPSDLETWLTDAGDRVLRKPEPWSPGDQLVHEVWLFDTEARNGGVSQYFANWPERWPMLRDLAAKELPSFVPLVEAVEEAMSEQGDLYKAALAADERLEAAWLEHQEAVVRALKAAVTPAGGGASTAPLQLRLEPLLSRAPSQLEGPDGQIWELHREPASEPWMDDALPAGSRVFADNGVGDYLYLSPDNAAVMVYRHEGPELYRYCDSVEQLHPEHERRQSGHPPVRYHGGSETVQLGDRVEVRYRLFFKSSGRVTYVPGVSPKRPALERAGMAWVTVRFDEGGGVETVVLEDGSLKKTVRLLERER